MSFSKVSLCTNLPLGLPVRKHIMITVCVKVLKTYHTLYLISEIFLFALSEEEAILLFIVFF